MEPELLVLVTPENCSKLIGKRVILILPKDEAAEEVKEDLKISNSTKMGIEIEAPTSERAEDSQGEFFNAQSSSVITNSVVTNLVTTYKINTVSLFQSF
jgi:hypothetical protein